MEDDGRRLEKLEAANRALKVLLGNTQAELKALQGQVLVQQPRAPEQFFRQPPPPTAELEQRQRKDINFACINSHHEEVYFRRCLQDCSKEARIARRSPNDLWRYLLLKQYLTPSMVAGLKLPPINGASSENIKKFQNGDGTYISHEIVAALISVAMECFPNVLESKRQARTKLKSCLSYLPNWKVLNQIQRTPVPQDTAPYPHKPTYTPLHARKPIFSFIDSLNEDNGAIIAPIKKLSDGLEENLFEQSNSAFLTLNSTKILNSSSDTI